MPLIGSFINTTLSDLGITASASELNTLDGITATTTELNYTDGVTSAIQTQINSKKLELIGTHTATGAESTYSFSSLSLNLDTTYSRLLLRVSGNSTASLTLELQINGLTAGYNWEILRQTGATVSGVTGTAQAFMNILNAGLMADSRIFISETIIEATGYTDNVMFISTAGTAGQGKEISTGGITDTSIPVITDVTVLTSASTWATGTKLELYGVKL